MSRLLVAGLLIGATALIAPHAHAQGALVVPACGTAQYTNGMQPLTQDPTGHLCQSPAGGGGAASTNLTQVNGVTVNLGQMTMASSFPVTIASDQSALLTSLASVVAQASTTSGQSVNLAGATVVSGTPVDSVGQSYPLTLNTSGLLRVVVGAPANTSGASGVFAQDSATLAAENEQVPTATATAALAAVASTSLESSHVLKASAGNLYGVYAVATAAGFLMVVNAATAPSSPSAVTPIECIPVAANAEGAITFPNIPESYGAGITALYSSTGCFTYTASATAFIHGNIK